ncbi:hypothetical protein LDENG_00178890 [Lucifuga dentata]|nr:hypothetical protein LDENG_00178890 [Lucifuga dentata]
MGTTAGSLLLLLLISFTNANTSPDIITRLERVCEDLKEGDYAFTIDAVDPDGDTLIYSISGPDASSFDIDPNSGNVTIKFPLDREVKGILKIRATVFDGLNSFSRDITVVVRDANDNQPIFQQASYDVDVPENTAIGSTLFTVEATDADTGTASVVKYSIDEIIPLEGLSLFRIETNGDVILNGNLNFTSLSTFYRLKINASDGGGACSGEVVYQSSITFAFITVVDVPDLDPQFIKLPYVAFVEENSPVGMSVLKVTALDQDTGINDNINYSIESSTVNDLFSIQINDGVITVQSWIDRELVGDNVTLTVKATEANLNIHGVLASAIAVVDITIIDINDNKPEFYSCGGPREELSCTPASHFTGEIFEHSLGAVNINMTVKDADKNSKTKLILEGVDKDVFSVAPDFTISDSIVQLIVKQPERLDFEEKQQMVLQVIAIDQELESFRSTATVTVKIMDTNDNSPVFPKDTYRIQVPEHSPVGTIIANITAEDPDTMDEGKITYRLLPDSILNYFDVEPNTGSVYVKNESLIDREVRSLYSATLQARDKDDKPGSTVLEITLTDINDKEPVFNRDSYLVFVKEGEQVELPIEATDADDPDTENSQIVYGIMPSRYSKNFTIDPNSGMLRNNSELDLEAVDPKLEGKIELTITATDKGIPALSSNVTVIINVEDVNDHGPEFNQSSYKFYVKEGQKGAYVGSVYAKDQDQTMIFNRISFSIIDGSFGSFIIRTFPEEWGYRGNIAVDQGIELDYESVHKNFMLEVEASDLEQKKAVVMVEVEVVDVNDERPEFKPSKPVTVKENTTITGAIGRFTGVDKDGNHSLVYELESLQCRCNGTKWTPCDWFILEPSGEIMVNTEQTVDYELCDQALMKAQVVDKFTEKGENSSVTPGEIVINIEDINDNAPEFIRLDTVFVVVAESANKGTSVARVSATDRDSEINQQIKFDVTSVQFQETNNQTTTMGLLFEAIDTQQNDFYVGIIQLKEGLNTKLQGKYLVTVTATDSSGLSTSTVLDIFTVDESYKTELRFAIPYAEVKEKEEELIRTLMSVTKAAVQVVQIKPETAVQSRASDQTIMEAYFIYPNGTALAANAVEKIISTPEHFVVLAPFGLSYIGNIPVTEKEPNIVMYVLLGMVGGFIIVLMVLTTSLVCTRRNYRRKLKAAKAMNSAAMVASENQQSGPVVPGTNKYTIEGANPVLNLNIDTAMVLGLDEESSDVDRVSINSLDYNDDMTVSVKDTRPIMVTEAEGKNLGPSEYIEPLGAALAQRGMKKKPDSNQSAFSNPALSTTDL